MKTLYPLILILLLFASCSTKTKNENVADLSHYGKYLNAASNNNIPPHVALWNSKIQIDSTQTLALATVGDFYEKEFRRTGDPSYLKKAEKALSKAYKHEYVDKAGMARKLGRFYITQHQFPCALEMARKAERLGSGLRETHALLFDVLMELGKDKEAKKYLDLLENQKDFGYLIRVAKWNDHVGDLATAIRFLENARDRAIERKNKDHMLWAYANLGDFYGHAGRIQEAYNSYLRTLELDPTHAHALKGIAWIAYANDGDTGEALAIIDALGERYASPDLDWLRSQMYATEGKWDISKEYFESFVQNVSQPVYKGMYHSYVAFGLLEFGQDFIRAHELAAMEVSTRTIAETQALLAYSLWKQGMGNRAVNLLDTEVWEQTGEPFALLMAARVYEDQGKLDKAQVLKKELESASFELGPWLSRKVLSL